MNFRLRGRLAKSILSILAKKFPAREFDWAAVDPNTTSGLRKFFGNDQLADFTGKRVLDFGCGRGADVVAAALAGAAEAVGVDVQAHHISDARKLAERFGVTHLCRFINAKAEPEAYAELNAGFDVVLSIDSFEHYDDPQAILREIDKLLAPGGRVIVSFGPPWKHPLGAHLTGWIRLPWIHFLFDEETVLAVRSEYFGDGASRYEEVPGGLNRMTIESFRKLILRSPFQFKMFDAVPIRKTESIARIPFLTEYMTSIVRAVCVRETH